jgi:hypothetical protein
LPVRACAYDISLVRRTNYLSRASGKWVTSKTVSWRKQVIFQPWYLFVRGQLPVADEKHLYKAIPIIVSTEASTIVKCRNGNNDDGNGPEILEIKKLRSEIQIKTFWVGRGETYIFFYGTEPFHFHHHPTCLPYFIS